MCCSAESRLTEAEAGAMEGGHLRNTLITWVGVSGLRRDIRVWLYSEEKANQAYG